MVTPRIEKALTGFHHREVSEDGGHGPRTSTGQDMGISTH